mgnify:CR=1 FL=1
MNRLRSAPIALALLLAFSGTACTEEARQSVSEARATVAEATAEGGTIDRAFAEARESMRTENLTLSASDATAKAELTPQGDLLINGVEVPLNAEQRAAALAYREELLAIGEAGMAIGREGMDIAGDALALAAAGLFGGDTTPGEAAIEAKGKALEAAGVAICERVHGLAAAQERLSALVPEIRPYTESIDVNVDCSTVGKPADAPPGPEGMEAAAPTVRT